MKTNKLQKMLVSIFILRKLRENSYFRDQTKFRDNSNFVEIFEIRVLSYLREISK